MRLLCTTSRRHYGCARRADHGDEDIPSEDVERYAEYLGFDLSSYPELLWLAEEACDAPLPADWASHTDANGEVFYYNTTGTAADSTSTYEHPLDGHFKTLYSIMSSQQSNQSELPAAPLDRRATLTIFEEGEEQHQHQTQEGDSEDSTGAEHSDSEDDGGETAAFSTPSKQLHNSSDGGAPLPEDDVT